MVKKFTAYFKVISSTQNYVMSELKQLFESGTIKDVFERNYFNVEHLTMFRCQVKLNNFNKVFENGE